MSQSGIPREGVARQRRRDNNRVTVRYRCAPATIGKIHVGDDEECQYAWIQNLSLAGLGVLLARPVSAGTAIELQIRGVSSGTAYTLAARVVYCAAQFEGNWMVGCEFTEPLTAQVLDDLL